MELLERYLYQIEKYLPMKDRKDTLEELKNLLLEDLDRRMENGEEEHIALYSLIREFGEPKEVALKYRNDPPIISREMEPILYLVLKIVMIVAPLGILLASSIDFLDNGEPFNIINLLINILYTIPDMFSAFVGAAGSVFIIFALIERFGRPYINEELKKMELPNFEPSHLPKIPVSVYKVSIFESVTTIVGSIVFVYILNYQPGLIAIYYDGDSIPLLNDSFNNLLPVLNVNILFGAGIAIAFLIMRRKTIVTATLEFIHVMFSGVILIFLATGNIFNEVIIEGYNLGVVKVIFIILMIIGAIGAFIGGLVKYGKILLAKSGKEEIIKDYINKQ